MHRHLSVASMVLSSVALALAIVANVRTPSTIVIQQPHVEARAFRLVDADGKTYGKWDVDHGIPSFSMSAGPSQVQFSCLGDSTIVRIGQGKTRFNATLDDGVQLTQTDADGHDRFTFEINKHWAKSQLQTRDNFMTAEANNTDAQIFVKGRKVGLFPPVGE